MGTYCVCVHSIFLDAIYETYLWGLGLAWCGKLKTFFVHVSVAFLIIRQLFFDR